MRGRGWLGLAAALLLAGVSAGAGYQVARWQAGTLDILCPGDFTDYRTRKALGDGQGIELPAGTQLRLRFCEYNAQAQLELLIDKSEFDQLQPLATPPSERWLYNLQPASEGER